MKKTKNLLLVAVLFVSVFVFAGMVKAADPWGFQEAWLVCNPEAVEPNEDTTCYYFGKVSGTTTTPNAGFYTKMYTTDKLTIEEVHPNKNLSNALGLFVKTSGSQAASIPSFNAETMPAGLQKFKCEVETEKDTNSRGCGVFYTKKGSENAYSIDLMKSYDKLTDNDITASSYDVTKTAVLGDIVLHLEKNDVDKCGNICISSYAVAVADDWSHGDCSAHTGTSEWDGSSCVGDDVNITQHTQPHHLPDGNEYDCFELEMKVKETQNTETGAFVSYAILAAGALIAISAVTIAKKHNRLQKI